MVVRYGRGGVRTQHRGGMGVEREEARLPALSMSIDRHGAKQRLMSQVHTVEVPDAQVTR